MKDSIKIEGFKSVEFVGAGPYWTLYEAVRLPSGTRHLLQLLETCVANDSNFVTLFQGLLGQTSRLRHAKILAPHAYEETFEHKFLIYDYFYGQSLQYLMDAQIPLLERRVIAIIRQITETLQFAQIRGLRHGWLCPNVVLFSKFNDEVKIFGFGSERLYAHLYDRNQDRAATAFPYIPPENLSSGAAPTPEDSYALGLLFYQLLVGKSPFSQKKVPNLKQEKLSCITPPHKINAKLSRQSSDLALALLEAKPHLRANFSTILNVLSPQEDTLVPADSDRLETTRLRKVRDFFSGAASVSKKLVGSKKRIAYSTMSILIFLVMIVSLVAFTYLASRNEQRVQRVYGEFIAEQKYEESDISLRSSSAVSNAAPRASTNTNESFLSEKRSIKQIPERVAQSDNETLLEDKPNVPNEGASAESTKVSLGIDETSGQKDESEERLKTRFSFAAVPYADKILINDESSPQNLPCDIELLPGVVQLTYIDSKSNFSWSTIVELSESFTTIAPPSEQIGTGELTVVLREPVQYGYVYVRINDETEQHSTPLRRRLTVGWHRIRIFRQNLRLAPADTSLFIRPNSQTSLECTVL